MLDEPSAALDARSERELNRLMAGLAGEKTLLLITHRLSATARMDRICVLGDGCVLESGSHEELLRKDGAYARLWRAQASPIRWNSWDSRKRKEGKDIRPSPLMPGR